MPMPIHIAHRLAERLAAVRKDGTLDYLGPDGKTQVTVRYARRRPVEVEKLLISTQHAEGVERSDDQARPLGARGRAGARAEAHELYDEAELLESFLVNPTGKFVIGGPVGDAGLTGRKIIVDTYGGMARHGGGAFSGKDPSKVDRSAAYAARYVAKNVVAAGLAERCEVQVAYAIGVAHPVSLMVETFGTGKLPDAEIVAARRERVRPAPGRLPPATSTCTGRSSRRPPPTATSAARTTDFTWERTDRADALRDAAGPGRRDRVGGRGRRAPQLPEGPAIAGPSAFDGPLTRARRCRGGIAATATTTRSRHARTRHRRPGAP